MKYKYYLRDTTSPRKLEKYYVQCCGSGSALVGIPVASLSFKHCCGLADPNPDPSVPYFFGPLGSGSISQRYHMDPDPSITKQK
jgi:hypothetical protein